MGVRVAPNGDARHKIITVNKEFVQSGENSFWALLVEYMDFNVTPSEKGQIDYKAVLSQGNFELFSQFSKHFDYFLKLDIKKYFNSIAHTKLKEVLSHLCKDKALLGLFSKIVDSYSG